MTSRDRWDRRVTKPRRRQLRECFRWHPESVRCPRQRDAAQPHCPVQASLTKNYKRGGIHFTQVHAMGCGFGTTLTWLTRRLLCKLLAPQLRLVEPVGRTAFPDFATCAG